MKLKNILISLFILLVFGCSKSEKDEYPYPDQFGGEDLFSQLSQDEKTMIGTWYFAYEQFKLQNGRDSLSYHSGTWYADLNNPNQTDTLKIFSNEFVGFSWTCPYEKPNKSVKVIEPRSSKFFPFCWAMGVNGWLIENDNLIHYRGYNINSYYYYSFQHLNNDSIVFLYKDWPIDNYKGIDKEYVIFYKK